MIRTCHVVSSVSRWPVRGVGWLAIAFVAGLGCGDDSRQVGWVGAPLGEVTSVASALEQPAIAVDADGRPVVAYVDDHAALLVKKWNGSTWVQLGEALNDNGSVASSPAVTLDAGALAVAWEEAVSTDSIVRVARFDGTAWRRLGTQISPATSVAHGPRIASGTQGLVVAYYGGLDREAVVSLWSGSTWQDWPRLPSQNAGTVDLALLADGSPAVTWIYSNWQGSIVQNEASTRYWNTAAGGWGSLPSIGLQASASAFLASDSDGALFLAVHDASTSSQPIRRAIPGASDWQTVGLPDVPLRSEGPLVALPGTGVAVAFSGDSSWGVARYTGSLWEVVATVGGQPCSIAGGQDGTLYVSWWAGLPNETFSAPVQVASFRRP